MTRLTLIALCSMIAVLALACTPSDPQASTDPSETDDVSAPAVAFSEPPQGQAPDFTLPTLAGDSLRLADLEGRYVLLNFWATYCTPCIAEMPDLQALHDELGADGLSVVGVSLDIGEEELVRSFVEQLHVSYPIALNGNRVADDLGGIWALPTTYLIDPEGRIVHRYIGLYPTDEMRPRLRELLSERTAESG